MLLTLAALQAATVTFAAPTDAAARLLPKLGAAAGLRLEADRRAGQQVLLLRVQGIDRNRLLSLVAEATGGAWERIEGGYRLRMGEEELKVLKAEETKRRLPWIETALRAQAGTTLGKAAALVGPAALAALAPGDRVVWSTSPTSLQRALPKESLALPGLEAERSDLGSISKRVVVASGAGSPPPPPTGTAATLLLSARRGLDARAVGLCLAAYNAQGRRVGSHEGVLVPPPAERPPLSPDVLGKVVRAPWTQGPADQDAKEILGKDGPIVVDGKKTILVLGTPPPPTSLSEVQARPAHPEKNEPLALAAGPVLDAVADAAGKNVVAALPDSAYFATDAASPEGRTVGRWLDAFEKEGMRFRLEGPTLVGLPIAPSAMVTGRSDRAELRRMFASMETQGNLTLDFPSPNRFETAVLPRDAALGAGGWMRSIREWNLARAWQTLSPAERAATFRGRVPVPSSAFWKSILRAQQDPENERDAPPMDGIVFEPTVLFAQGKGSVSANVKESVATVFAWPGDPYPDLRTGFAGAAEELAKGPQSPLWKTAFWPATRRDFTMEIWFEVRQGPLDIQIRLSPVELGEIVRAPGPPSYAPNLFPALGIAVERARHGG